MPSDIPLPSELAAGSRARAGREIPRPQGDYQPAVRSGALLVSAGMTPRVSGTMQYPGVVGQDVTLDDARAAAALAVGNAVTALESVVSPTEWPSVRIVRMTVYVNAVPGFTQHSAVADGASRVLGERLGDRGRPVRSAVGVQSLPGGACLEIELTAHCGDGTP